MKHIKTSLFLLFSAIGSSAFCNPLPVPVLKRIDSLSFTQDSWSMNLQLGYDDPSVFDSILFITHTDTANLNMSLFDKFVRSEGVALYVGKVKISEANLSKPLPLKQSGGYLNIKWYRNDYDDVGTEVLKYGTEPGACIRAPKADEYISPIYEYKNGCDYTLCNEHSCSIQMKGKIYNADGTLLKNVQPVSSYDQPEYTTDSEGNYVKMLSVDTIKNINTIDLGYNQSYPIETITIDGNPGDVINKDIHLKEMYVSEKEIGQPEAAMFFTYPNPASKEIHFSYRILDALSDCTIEIFSNEGMLLGHLPISQQEGDVSYLLGEAFPAGSYTYSVSNNKTVIYRGRFFVQ